MLVDCVTGVSCTFAGPEVCRFYFSFGLATVYCGETAAAAELTFSTIYLHPPITGGTIFSANICSLFSVAGSQ